MKLKSLLTVFLSFMLVAGIGMASNATGSAGEAGSGKIQDPFVVSGIVTDKSGKGDKTKITIDVDNDGNGDIVLLGDANGNGVVKQGMKVEGKAGKTVGKDTNPPVHKNMGWAKIGK